MNNRKPYVFDRKIAKKLLPDAIKLARMVRVDELDCSVSFKRQKSNKTVDEMLTLCLDKSIKVLWHFIYRDQSFLPQEYLENRDYWDVGFSTLTTGPSYFLWIELEVKDGYDLVKKYKLKEH